MHSPQVRLEHGGLLGRNLLPHPHRVSMGMVPPQPTRRNFSSHSRACVACAYPLTAHKLSMARVGVLHHGQIHLPFPILVCYVPLQVLGVLRYTHGPQDQKRSSNSVISRPSQQSCYALCSLLTPTSLYLMVEGGSGSLTVFSKLVLPIRTAGNGFAHMLH